MTLSLVYRLNGLIGLIWAASMWLTPEMMAAQFQFWKLARYGYDGSIFRHSDAVCFGNVFDASKLDFCRETQKSHYAFDSASSNLLISSAVSYFYEGDSIWQHAIFWCWINHSIYSSFLLEITLKKILRYEKRVLFSFSIENFVHKLIKNILYLKGGHNWPPFILYEINEH